MVLSPGGADHRKSVIVTGSGQSGLAINGKVLTPSTYLDQCMFFLKHSLNMFDLFCA